MTGTTLLRGLRDPGNDAVWTQYVERFRPLILQYVRRLGLSEVDAEDVAQTALAEFAAGYRAGQYKRERGRLRSWLFGIVHNHVRNCRRREWRQGMTLDVAAVAEAEPVALETRELEALWEQEWRSALLLRLLKQIQREVEPQTLRAFELFALRERSAQSVARELGISRAAVFGAKKRILRRLRELMPLIEDLE